MIEIGYNEVASEIYDRVTSHYLNSFFCLACVVVKPRTILPQRNRCALSATRTRKSEEEKDASGVDCFMEENEISLREVA